MGGPSIWKKYKNHKHRCRLIRASIRDSMPYPPLESVEPEIYQVGALLASSRHLGGNREPRNQLMCSCLGTARRHVVDESSTTRRRVIDDSSTSRRLDLLSTTDRPFTIFPSVPMLSIFQFFPIFTNWTGVRNTPRLWDNHIFFKTKTEIAKNMRRFIGSVRDCLPYPPLASVEPGTY